jgi:hypothetical protein
MRMADDGYLCTGQSSPSVVSAAAMASRLVTSTPGSTRTRYTGLPQSTVGALSRHAVSAPTSRPTAGARA